MRILAVTFAVLILGAGTCNDNNGEFTQKDGGTLITPTITFADIGTVCTYDPANPQLNPSNTCGKAGLTCVIATADGQYRQYGNFLYEAVRLFTRFLPDGTDEGICTVVAPPGYQLSCPSGTVPVQLSSGHFICMRGCENSSDCNRDGFVCDRPFAVYDSATGYASPSSQRVCVPGCQTDLVYCTRTFIVPGDNGAVFLGVYDADLSGNRVCNRTTGTCETNSSNGSGFVGDRCVDSSDCRSGLICINGMLYGASENDGFCAQYCDPNAEPQNPIGPLECVPGQGCDYFLSIGYCFPDCQSNICAGEGQVCAVADPYTAGLAESQAWSRAHCIQCELSSLPCGTTQVDAGSEDARPEDAS